MGAQDPFKLTAELYNIQFPGHGYLGERCFDGTVGSPEAREKACADGKVWVLGYFLGCDWSLISAGQPSLATLNQESAHTTNCFYWAISSSLCLQLGRQLE